MKSRRRVNSTVMSLVIVQNKWNLRWPFTTIGIGFALVYGVLSLAIIPACGLGTGILIITAFGPYGIALLFWPVIAFLLADLKSIVTKCLVVILLVAHYGFIFIVLNRANGEEWQRFNDTIRSRSEEHTS